MAGAASARRIAARAGADQRIQRVARRAHRRAEDGRHAAGPVDHRERLRRLDAERPGRRRPTARTAGRARPGRSGPASRCRTAMAPGGDQLTRGAGRPGRDGQPYAASRPGPLHDVAFQHRPQPRPLRLDQRRPGRVRGRRRAGRPRPARPGSAARTPAGSRCPARLRASSARARWPAASPVRAPVVGERAARTGRRRVQEVGVVVPAEQADQRADRRLGRGAAAASRGRIRSHPRAQHAGRVVPGQHPQRGGRLDQRGDREPAPGQVVPA